MTLRCFVHVASEHCFEFQLFQLTAMYLRVPVEEILQFELNLDHVTINHRANESAFPSVQLYVGNVLFTQRNFSTDNGISMLLGALGVASSVWEDSLLEPWPCVLTE